ncbi:Abscisic acid 8'-hydroxylase CYP707A2 [Linum perenne]
MGWPYVGETFQLYSQDPNVFFASKVKKFGSILKTHILGCPCVMVSSPEAAKFVLVTKSNLFKPTFPAIIKQSTLFFSRFMSDFFFVSQYTFNVALLSIFGNDATLYREDLKRCYYILEKGYNSMPVNIPGTLFHKAMKARKELALILAKIMAKRREMNIDDHNDLLGSFMEDKEGLTDEQIADNVIGVIFAARDTTASALTWVLKFLGDNPAVLQAVTEEQEEIAKEMRTRETETLSWGDTKKMPISSRVIQETLRVASILSFTFREAVEDVEYEGYMIPKGWKVLPLFRNIHHSPDNFTDPEKFDPSRFEVAAKPNTFMPFGSGTHSCPGNELAKVEILVLLHHLTTKYRWSMVGDSSGIQYGPFALPQNGLPIKLSFKK